MPNDGPVPASETAYGVLNCLDSWMAMNSSARLPTDEVADIRSVQELKGLVKTASAEQRTGNFRPALKKFELILKRIDATLKSPTAADDFTPTEIDYMKQQQAEIMDLVLAIKSSLEIVNIDVPNFDVQSDTFARQLNEEEAERQLQDRIEAIKKRKALIKNYNYQSTCALISSLIAMAIGVWFFVFLYSGPNPIDFGISEYDASCTPTAGIHLQVFMGTATAISVPTFLLGLFTKMGLRRIQWNYEKLDMTTDRLWPKGSFFDVFEDNFGVITFVRLIWFAYGFFIISNQDIKACFTEESSLRAMVVSAYVFAGMGIWMSMLACICLPCFSCLFICLICHLIVQEKKKAPVGMSQKHFDRLETIKYKQGLLDEEHATCAICWVDFEQDQEVRLLPCSGKHIFHAECVDQWLQKSDTCPQCREHIIQKINDNRPQRSRLLGLIPLPISIPPVNSLATSPTPEEQV